MTMYLLILFLSVSQGELSCARLCMPDRAALSASFECVSLLAFEARRDQRHLLATWEKALPVAFVVLHRKYIPERPGPQGGILGNTVEQYARPSLTDMAVKIPIGSVISIGHSPVNRGRGEKMR